MAAANASISAKSMTAPDHHLWVGVGGEDLPEMSFPVSIVACCTSVIKVGIHNARFCTLRRTRDPA